MILWSTIIMAKFKLLYPQNVWNVKKNFPYVLTRIVQGGSTKSIALKV